MLGSFLKQDAVGAYIWASMYEACVKLFLYIWDVWVVQERCMF